MGLSTFENWKVEEVERVEGTTDGHRWAGMGNQRESMGPRDRGTKGPEERRTTSDGEGFVNLQSGTKGPKTEDRRPKTEDRRTTNDGGGIRQPSFGKLEGIKRSQGDRSLYARTDWHNHRT